MLLLGRDMYDWGKHWRWRQLLSMAALWSGAYLSEGNILRASRVSNIDLLGFISILTHRGYDPVYA